MKEEINNVFKHDIKITFNTNVPVLRTFEIDPDDEEVMKNHHQC